ncbi:MAG: hypothetical protein M0P47_09260 [Bacteroidales bacterium]|nr:hypothetical protein [Bacteroidales bacterium]
MKKPGLIYFDRAEFNRSLLEAIQKPVEEVCLTDRIRRVRCGEVTGDCLLVGDWWFEIVFIGAWVISEHPFCHVMNGRVVRKHLKSKI